MSEERLKQIKKHIEEMGVYQFTHFLDIDIKEVANEDNYNYNYKLTNLGLNYLIAHPKFDEALIESSFPKEIHEGIMQSHNYFLTNSNKAYKELVLMLNNESNKNLIFDKIESVFNDKNDFYIEYKVKFIKFLNELILQENNFKIIEENFKKVIKEINHDKNDYSQLLETFIKKGISADKVFNQIIPLNNFYLENKLYEFTIENGIDCKFIPKEVNMLETEDKTIYETTIKFNKNYFMKSGINEKTVENNLNVFFDLILNEENLNYLVTTKDKELKLVLRSIDEKFIQSWKNKILKSSELILEFVKNYDQTEEYRTKFLNYFKLNEAFNLNHKSQNKMKI